jgi:DNA damage-binding protein 1
MPVSEPRAAGQLETRAYGDMSDRIGRPCESGHLGAVDPLCRLVGLHLYDGALKVLPLVGGTFKEAFNVRLEELTVLDLRFLHVPPDKPPLLAVLHQDSREKRHLKT